MEKKVTFLIIGNDDEEVKSFKIDADLYRKITQNYRKYLYIACSAAALFLIVMASMFAFSLKLGLDKQSLSGELTNATTQLEQYDSMRLHQKLNSIDNNLSMIDAYLQQRGLVENGNAGGEPSATGHDVHIEKIDYLEKKSVVFYNTIKEVPVGYPYYGVRSSDYGYRRNPFGGYSGEFHPGVDIKGPVGDPICATGDGIIERCDWYGGYGNAVVINHKSGYQSLYGHLTRVNVVQGQQVKAGDIIGFLGSTGRSTGPHVHYEIRKNGEDISPEPFLRLY